MKNEESCYMCHRLATSNEHVPPKCIFPEQKDVRLDFRKNLVTVPACDIHNLRKSTDDEYLLGILAFHWKNNQIAYEHSISKIKRALKRNKKYFDLFFGKEQHQFVYWDQQNLVTAPVDIERVNFSIDAVVRGIYFHQFKEKWLNNVVIHHLSLSPMFDKKTAERLWKEQHHIAQLAKSICVQQTKHGENPDIFYYQFVQDTSKSRSLIMLLVFYGGFEVMAFLNDTDDL